MTISLTEKENIVCRYIGCNNPINKEISEIFCTEHSQEMDRVLEESPASFISWSLHNVEMFLGVDTGYVHYDYEGDK